MTEHLELRAVLTIEEEKFVGEHFRVDNGYKLIVRRETKQQPNGRMTIESPDGDFADFLKSTTKFLQKAYE